MDVPKSDIILSISCQNLLSLDKTSKSDPMAVLFEVNPQNHQVAEVGRTENLKNQKNPVFTKSFDVTYFFEKIQLYRITIYDVDKKSDNLKKHDVIGSIQFNLGELMGSSGCALNQPLLYDKKPNRKNGSCKVSAEEKSGGNAIIHCKLRGIKLDKKDRFGKSDPYVVFYRSEIEGEGWIPAHETEYLKSTLNPVWKPFSIAAHKLGGDPYRKIRMTCYDWNKSGKPDLIGHAETTLDELVNQNKREFALIEPKKAKKKKYQNSGILEFTHLKYEKQYSFLDYLAGGTEISLVVAVDYTGSNGKFTMQNSLHYTGSGQLNDYQNAIYYIGQILAQYDTSNMFPAFGFGAKIGGQVSHCFPLTGNQQNPYCMGVQGLLQAYLNSFNLPAFTLWGPTNFAPIITSTAQICRNLRQQGNQKYFILLILTDGEITDMNETISAIIEASDLPLSIVIVGIGPANFGSMEKLDSDEKLLTYNGKTAKRDIVQFVPLRDYKNKGMGELARVTLAEIPGQFLSYHKKHNIPPNERRTFQN
ncbi:copine [Anaeramoeba flamelloides]|uniref:Copine-3 n=1 Tax=Anaeramoeba flamelloides TaxID=1746091 RepID=A0AAV7Z6D4_9EUKA|nr:copine [Anaeramoeba flamelloides]